MLVEKGQVVWPLLVYAQGGAEPICEARVLMDAAHDRTNRFRSAI